MVSYFWISKENVAYTSLLSHTFWMPPLLQPLDLITLIINDDYKLYKSSQYNFIYFPVTSTLFSLNIFLCILLSNTINLFSSPNVRQWNISFLINMTVGVTQLPTAVEKIWTHLPVQEIVRVREANCETLALSWEHDMLQAVAQEKWACTEHWLLNLVSLHFLHCKATKFICSKIWSFIKHDTIIQCHNVSTFSIKHFLKILICCQRSLRRRQICVICMTSIHKWLVICATVTSLCATVSTPMAILPCSDRREVQWQRHDELRNAVLDHCCLPTPT